MAMAGNVAYREAVRASSPDLPDWLTPASVIDIDAGFTIVHRDEVADLHDRSLSTNYSQSITIVRISIQSTRSDSCDRISNQAKITRNARVDVAMAVIAFQSGVPGQY
jgi:hypothetical protein